MAIPSKSLSALLKQSSIDDHEEILKACNTALKATKNDPELLHVRLVALLKLDRYEDALQVLEESGDRLKERAKVEKAYALYRTGKLQDAKALARSVVENRGARHIEAQAVRKLHLLPSRDDILNNTPVVSLRRFFDRRYSVSGAY